jgi:hypothetical protein
MPNKTRIRYHLVLILCAVLCHETRGFTPLNPRFVQTRTPLRVSGSPGKRGSGGGGRGNKNSKGFLGSSDDGLEPSGHLPILLGGGGAWLWTFLLQTEESYAVSSAVTVPSWSSPVVLSTSAVVGSQAQKWRVLLAAALLVLQAVGVHAAQLCATVARQGSHWYLARLTASPLITKSITSGVIGVCGDYCAQWLDHQLKRRKHDATAITDTGMTYNARRGLAVLVDGLFVSGPLMHFGYNFFETLIPSGHSLGAIAHVIADSIILDSVFVGTAIIGTGLVEGYRFQQDICPQLQQDYGETLKASWATSAAMVPLQFVCFRFLPIALRALAMNVTDILWGGVISFMTHKGRQHKEMPMMMLAES